MVRAGGQERKRPGAVAAVRELGRTIRFTWRRPGSIWSGVNIRRARVLIEQGLMQPSGLEAYRARRENKSGIYSYDQRTVELDEPYDRLLEKNQRAWKFFHARPPSYRKAVSWWIISARKEETRLKRLEKLIAYSVRGRKVPEMTPSRPAR